MCTGRLLWLSQYNVPYISLAPKRPMYVTLTSIQSASAQYYILNCLAEVTSFKLTALTLLIKSILNAQ